MADKNKKILIAEDDEFIANAYRVKLEKENFEVAIAEDGEKLLEKVKELKPDAILLDLVMPVMDGFEALEKLKEDKDTKDIPVIIASNLGQQKDLDKGMELGAEDYIIKTNMSLKEVISKIKKMLP